MAMEKVSLTLDAKALKEARRRAGKRGLSAFVDEALLEKLQGDRLGELLDDLDRKYGPVPEEVQREVDKEWDEASARLKRFRRSSSTRGR